MCIYGPVSRVPTPAPPPWDGGGVWCPCGGVYTYIHTYIPTYLPTYLRTYIHTYHYITLPYITLPYLTLPYLTFHTYIHTIPLNYLTLHYLTLPYITLPYIPYIHTYQHTYQHTNIPTYQHTTTTGHGGGDQKNHTTATGHRGGGDQKNHTTTTGHRGGGDQKNQTILSTHTHWWGGEGGWPTLHHIYIHTETWYNLSGKSSTGCQQNDKIWWYQPQRQSSSRYPKMGILLVVIFVDSLIFAAKNFKHVRACPTPRGIIALYFPGYNKQRPLTALTTCGRALLEDQRFLSVYRRMRLRS